MAYDRLLRARFVVLRIRKGHRKRRQRCARGEAGEVMDDDRRVDSARDVCAHFDISHRLTLDRASQSLIEGLEIFVVAAEAQRLHASRKWPVPISRQSRSPAFPRQNMTGRDSNLIARAALPFFVMLVVCIAIITIWPQVVTWLHDFVMGQAT